MYCFSVHIIAALDLKHSGSYTALGNTIFIFHIFIFYFSFLIRLSFCVRIYNKEALGKASSNSEFYFVLFLGLAAMDYALDWIIPVKDIATIR